ncbi:MAG: HPr family phosphocarrier protein [Proteobacteria bacterium]|nr:HPr family phosphocarrier protein [Pseudomonadota bacterium]GBF29917.1 phosphocarrier protein HPr [bacterium MnTg03]
MISENITIINKLGLHARAASKLVSKASGFQSDVFIDKQGNRVNAKSIMGVMMLAAGKGTKVILEVDGSDEEDCMKAMIHLINNRFGEAE